MNLRSGEHAIVSRSIWPSRHATLARYTVRRNSTVLK